MTKVSSNDLNETEVSDLEVYLAVERKFVMDKGLSKTALRLLLLTADPMMDDVHLQWDESVFATVLGVHRRTVQRAVRELADSGVITVSASWGPCGSPRVGRDVEINFGAADE